MWMTFMNWIMNNYHIILIAIIILLGIYGVCVRFLKLTPSEQKRRINLILFNACRKAETELGSKTGKAKRAQVYAAFRQQMPIISLFLSEEQYDACLDKALEELKEWFAKNAVAAEKLGSE